MTTSQSNELQRLVEAVETTAVAAKEANDKAVAAKRKLVDFVYSLEAVAA